MMRILRIVIRILRVFVSFGYEFVAFGLYYYIKNPATSKAVTPNALTIGLISEAESVLIAKNIPAAMKPKSSPPKTSGPKRKPKGKVKSAEKPAAPFF